MAVATTDIPLPTPPVEPEAGADLTPAQWRVLLALCDAVVPGFRSANSPVKDGGIRMKDYEYKKLVREMEDYVSPDAPPGTAAAFLAETPSTSPEFKITMRRNIFTTLAQEDRVQFARALSALSTSVGALLLSRNGTPLMNQSLVAREKVLKTWAGSRVPTLRMLKSQVTLLTKQVWARTSPNLDNFLGIPRIPVDCPPPTGHEYRFIQLPPGDEPEVIEVDVVIVGSGCGGGVAARNLAESGLKVLVVDKAYHWSPHHMPMSSNTGLAHIYANGGSIMSNDSTTCIIAGQAWGGGGTINWSASLHLQGFVRRAWAADNLPLFTSPKFQESLDRVCAAMNVSSDVTNHSIPNQQLLEGSRKLGWAHKVVPQNSGGRTHTCGAMCTLGCRSSTKQGPAVAWLPKAAEAGARFMEGFDVETILFEKRGSKTMATGVAGTWASRDATGGTAGEALATRKVVVKAKKVIVSGGSMHSPLLLLRSGLRNKQIGKNLHVHPVCFVGAFYDEPVRPWEGTILSSVCSEFENLDGHGHGAKLEATCMTPFAWMSWLPWTGGLDYKRLATRSRHTGGFISIVRDRDTGVVTPDPYDGRIRFQYHPSQLDKNHIMEGLIGLARINYVQGAREIYTSIPHSPSFTRGAAPDGNDDDAFEEFVVRLRKHGFPSETLFVSAHQMGSCRMSSSAKTGVVDRDGQVFGVKDLYVMDASVFPSASGVNPFVTTMAIADVLSRSIAANWAGVKL